MRWNDFVGFQNEHANMKDKIRHPTWPLAKVIPGTNVRTAVNVRSPTAGGSQPFPTWN